MNTAGAVSTFTTAPVADQLEVFLDDFKRPADAWVEADTPTPRTLVAADAAHDPGGMGVFVPFLGADATPVAAIESRWLDSGAVAPRYDVQVALREPAGSSVRLFGRTTVANPTSDRPNLFLVGPWVDLRATSGALLGSRFPQLRIEFTVPPGATPTTFDVPFVDRVNVVGRRP